MCHAMQHDIIETLVIKERMHSYEADNNITALHTTPLQQIDYQEFSWHARGQRYPSIVRSVSCLAFEAFDQPTQ